MAVSVRAHRLFYSNNENSRSRRGNGPAIVNVLVLNVQRKENLTVGEAALVRVLLPGFRTDMFLSAHAKLHTHGKRPRTRVASATRPTARIMAPARGGTWCLRMVSTISWKARTMIFCRRWLTSSVS